MCEIQLCLTSKRTIDWIAYTWDIHLLKFIICSSRMRQNYSFLVGQSNYNQSWMSVVSAHNDEFQARLTEFALANLYLVLRPGHSDIPHKEHADFLSNNCSKNYFL